VLDLRRAPVRDLGPLRELPLRKLDLQGSAVADLTPLAGHPTLEHLELSETPVADIRPLLTCPRLCSVWLWGTQVPKAQAEELKRTMKASSAEPGPEADYEKILAHREINWYAE
jgi:Leucine-rich repeat (LRR) protein